MTKRLILIASALSMTAALGACNTVKGLGEDVKSVGKAGERAID